MSYLIIVELALGCVARVAHTRVKAAEYWEQGESFTFEMSAENIAQFKGADIVRERSAEYTAIGAAVILGQLPERRRPKRVGLSARILDVLGKGDMAEGLLINRCRRWTREQVIAELDTMNEAGEVVSMDRAHKVNGTNIVMWGIV